MALQSKLLNPYQEEPRKGGIAPEAATCAWVGTLLSSGASHVDEEMLAARSCDNSTEAMQA